MFKIIFIALLIYFIIIFVKLVRTLGRNNIASQYRRYKQKGETIVRPDGSLEKDISAQSKIIEEHRLDKKEKE